MQACMDPKLLHRNKKMKKLFLSLFILIAAAAVVHSQTSFHKFALQWPASYCTGTGNTCLDSAGSLKDFTIHGIWPHYRNSSSVPAYNPVTNRCVGPAVPPYPSQLDTLLDEQMKETLKKYWPNLTQHLNNQSDLSFWEYEWYHHGRCSRYAYDPLTYFGRGVDMITRNYNIVRMLHNQRIQTGTIQKGHAIIAALRRELGVFPQLHCNRNSTGHLQLLEIRICLDQNIANPRTCPKYYSDVCKTYDDVYFPASLPPPPP